jgi:hypothetical protein
MEKYFYFSCEYFLRHFLLFRIRSFAHDSVILMRDVDGCFCPVPPVVGILSGSRDFGLLYG